MYLSVGLLNIGLEFLFGHYVAGKPRHEVLQVFDIKRTICL